MWFQTLQFYTQSLGGWRKRRKGLANIMVDPKVRTHSSFPPDLHTINLHFLSKTRMGKLGLLENRISTLFSSSLCLAGCAPRHRNQAWGGEVRWMKGRRRRSKKSFKIARRAPVSKNSSPEVAKCFCAPLWREDFFKKLSVFRGKRNVGNGRRQQNHCSWVFFTFL